MECYKIQDLLMALWKERHLKAKARCEGRAEESLQRAARIIGVQ